MPLDFFFIQYQTFIERNKRDSTKPSTTCHYVVNYMLQQELTETLGSCMTILKITKKILSTPPFFALQLAGEGV